MKKIALILLVLWWCVGCGALHGTGVQAAAGLNDILYRGTVGAIVEEAEEDLPSITGLIGKMAYRQGRGLGNFLWSAMGALAPLPMPAPCKYTMWWPYNYWQCEHYYKTHGGFFIGDGPAQPTDRWDMFGKSAYPPCKGWSKRWEKAYPTCRTGTWEQTKELN